MSKLRHYNRCCDVVIILELVMMIAMMILILMIMLAMNNKLLYCEYYESMIYNSRMQYIKLTVTSYLLIFH